MFSESRASSLLTILAGCASLLLGTISYAQDALEIADRDLLARHEQLQQQLSEMESSRGRHDPALMEILSSLADSSVRLNLYSDASSLLERSLQIQRLSLGLFTTEQIPLILAKMDIDARGGDWESVNGSMEYLYWLLVEKNVGEGEVLIDNLIRLSEFHLRGVGGDAVDQQAHHYQQAAKITYRALRFSEESIAPHDKRVIDLNYSLVKQFYLQSAAVERLDDTAYALRAVVPGSKWVRPRRIAQSRYYSAGLRLLNEMRKILTQREADPAESLAMVDVYTADWHVLFDQNKAELAYQNAYDGLREADVDKSKLDLLFATPKILPVPAFHDTVSSALTSSYSARTRQQAEQGDDYLNFQKWLDTMLVISFPVIAPPQEQAKQEREAEIRLRFRLNSLNNVPRWLGGRYRTNMSVAEEFDFFESDEHPGIDIESLDDRLYLLHFRPHLEDGIARPWEGFLDYPAPVN